MLDLVEDRAHSPSLGRNFTMRVPGDVLRKMIGTLGDEKGFIMRWDSVLDWLSTQLTCVKNYASLAPLPRIFSLRPPHREVSTE